MRNQTDKQLPSPLLSLVPILVMVILLFLTISTFGSDALSGGSQVVLLTTTAVASCLAMLFCKVRWKVIEEAMCNNILGVSTALIILLLIGALSGAERYVNVQSRRHQSIFRTAMNASLGTDTVPTWRMRFLPSFCFSSSFFFLEMSPP